YWARSTVRNKSGGTPGNSGSWARDTSGLQDSPCPTCKEQWWGGETPLVMERRRAGRHDRRVAGRREGRIPPSSHLHRPYLLVIATTYPATSAPLVKPLACAPT